MELLHVLPAQKNFCYLLNLKKEKEFELLGSFVEEEGRCWSFVEVLAHCWTLNPPCAPVSQHHPWHSELWDNIISLESPSCHSKNVTGCSVFLFSILSIFVSTSVFLMDLCNGYSVFSSLGKGRDVPWASAPPHRPQCSADFRLGHPTKDSWVQRVAELLCMTLCLPCVPQLWGTLNQVSWSYSFYWGTNSMCLLATSSSSDLTEGHLPGKPQNNKFCTTLSLWRKRGFGGLCHTKLFSTRRNWNSGNPLNQCGATRKRRRFLKICFIAGKMLWLFAREIPSHLQGANGRLHAGAGTGRGRGRAAWRRT